MKVRCIEAGNTPHVGALTKGQVYEVVTKVGTDRYKLVGVNPPVWWQSRFEVVEETTYKVVVDCAINTTITPTTVTDPEEDRMWRAMRPRVEIGHCVCGCPKELCNYHR
jgi:hypothetical protein